MTSKYHLRYMSWETGPSKVPPSYTYFPCIFHWAIIVGRVESVTTSYMGLVSNRGNPLRNHKNNKPRPALLEKTYRCSKGEPPKNLSSTSLKPLKLTLSTPFVRGFLIPNPPPKNVKFKQCRACAIVRSLSWNGEFAHPPCSWNSWCTK